MNTKSPVELADDLEEILNHYWEEVDSTSTVSEETSDRLTNFFEENGYRLVEALRRDANRK